MAIPKIAALNMMPMLEKTSQPGLSFTQVFAQKKALIPGAAPVSPVAPSTSASGLNKIFDHMLSNHESVTAAMRSSVVKNRYSPQELLEKQFEIGTLLLREQMYAKTAESLTNSVKNFTQMQV